MNGQFDNMADMVNILIVDDDDLVLKALSLTFRNDYNVYLASSGLEAIKMLETNLKLYAVVLDIKMAPMDGLETARHIREINKDIPIIFHTGYPGDFSENEIEIEYCAFDYVTKQERPVRLVRAVKQAVNQYSLKIRSGDNVNLAKTRYGMIGSSDVMRKVYQTIEQIAPTDNKVIILGPTGTGKELVARALHTRSQRSGNRLAILNCNHKQPDLVESELFGHKRGAFTGAVEDRMGLFEYADKGTIFLDEIGDLDITTQAKILRALETGEVQKIGSPEIMKVDVRLICATHCDIAQMVKNNLFREDLYYRLKGIQIKLPPLRERKEDISPLVSHFVESYCMDKGNGLKVFDPSAIDLMIEYEWPGNIRQLQDTVRSLIDLTSSSYITRDDVAAYLDLPPGNTGDDKGLNGLVQNFKKTIIIKALSHHKGNVSAAARELQLDPANLHRMIKSLDINND